MTISVTELKARCLEVIREVERDGHPVDVMRRGKIVARIFPAAKAEDKHPWKRLHGSGRLLSTPEESMLDEGDFEAMR